MINSTKENLFFIIWNLVDIFVKTSTQTSQSKYVNFCSAKISDEQSYSDYNIWRFCQAQFQSSPSLVQLELSTALILVITPPPTQPRGK